MVMVCWENRFVVIKYRNCVNVVICSYYGVELLVYGVMDIGILGNE